MDAAQTIESTTPLCVQLLEMKNLNCFVEGNFDYFGLARYYKRLAI
ncbi:MAG: hypothetical protein ACOX62_03910 [Christensenellales bacterium]|jgi:hypothetical protein